MKKLTSILLGLALMSCLVLSVCADGIDLSSLSWDELIALKADINRELMSRDEWEEVEVPQGVYVVGEDIPAGKWTVRCKTGHSCYFQFGETLRDDGHSVSWTGTHDLVYIYRDSGSDGRLTEYTFDAVDGHYVIVSDAPAVFTPFTGNPDLGFKQK